MRAGNKGNTRSMPWNRSQFGLLLRLRRWSHLRHNFATSYRSRESMRMFTSAIPVSQGFGRRPGNCFLGEGR